MSPWGQTAIRYRFKINTIYSFWPKSLLERPAVRGGERPINFHHWSDILWPVPRLFGPFGLRLTIAKTYCYSCPNLCCDASRFPHTWIWWRKKLGASAQRSSFEFWGHVWNFILAGSFCSTEFFWILRTCLKFHISWSHTRSGVLRTQKLKTHLLRDQSSKVLPLKTCSRSVLSHACYAYCRGFLPCLFLPSRSVHLHFFQISPKFFLCCL